MVTPAAMPMPGKTTVSVLALSSRFDGLAPHAATAPKFRFQYSLCRVVLMVDSHLPVYT